MVCNMIWRSHKALSGDWQALEGKDAGKMGKAHAHHPGWFHFCMFLHILDIRMIWQKKKIDD